MSTRRSSSQIAAPPLGRAERGEDGGRAERLSRLTRIIEGEIVPRLLISATVASRSAALKTAESLPGSDAVAELARLLLAPQRDKADAYVQVVRRDGMPPERICFELLAPTARRLEEIWQCDECGLAELTIGLRRLASVLRDVTAGS